MSINNDRRERLKAKQKRDAEKRGGSIFSVLDTKDYSDIPWLKLKPEEEYALDIMPYIVTSKNHPDYEALKEADFMEDYKLDIHIHKNVGPSKRNVVCPQYNYGKPCPICEEHDRKKKEEGLDWKDDELRALRPSQKSFFNIIDLEDNDKLKFLEYSHYWFTKNLVAQAERKSKKRQILLGDISSDGFSIEFAPEVSQFDDKQPGEVKSFDFVPKENEYTDQDIEEAPKLDTMVKTLTYDEIYAMMYGEDINENKEETEEVEEEVAEERPARSRRAKKEEVVSLEKEVEEAPPLEEDKDEETPSSRRRARNRNRKETANECPAGLKFGYDIDSPGCTGEECSNYDKCDAKYIELEEEGKL